MAKALTLAISEPIRLIRPPNPCYLQDGGRPVSERHGMSRSYGLAPDRLQHQDSLCSGYLDESENHCCIAN